VIVLLLLLVQLTQYVMVHTMVDLRPPEEVEQLLLVDFALVQQLDHMDVGREIVDWLRKKSERFFFSFSLVLLTDE
jgi:hypothetical protein